MCILFCLLKLIHNRLNVTMNICFLFARNINLPITNENMDYTYHGCALKHSNGKNVITGSNEKCLTPTNKFFWKDPKDIISAWKTTSRLKKQPIAHCKTIAKWFEQRVNKIIKDQLANFEEKVIEIIDGWSKKQKELLVFLFFFCLTRTFIFIVNNGNILSDGRRIYLKHSDM